MRLRNPTFVMNVTLWICFLDRIHRAPQTFEKCPIEYVGSARKFDYFHVNGRINRLGVPIASAYIFPFHELCQERPRFSVGHDPENAPKPGP